MTTKKEAVLFVETIGVKADQSDAFDAKYFGSNNEGSKKDSNLLKNMKMTSAVVATVIFVFAISMLVFWYGLYNLAFSQETGEGRYAQREGKNKKDFVSIN